MSGLSLFIYFHCAKWRTAGLAVQAFYCHVHSSNSYLTTLYKTIHHTFVICIGLFLSSAVCFTELVFISLHCLFFWHFPACRLLWSSLVFGAGFDSVYTELCSSEFHRPFISSSTHILIYIYHLLRTLLMPPFFSHFTTVHPSFAFDSLLALSQHPPSITPLLLSPRTFYILHASHFPLPLPYPSGFITCSNCSCCSHSFCSFPSFSPVNLVRFLEAHTDACAASL